MHRLGENLIFLISQPRAGSTLLQRILGSHPDIHTVSEPWLMLHPLYALRPDGHQAEYNAFSARTAVQGFLQTVPRGEDEYVEGMRRMYAYLYERALASSGKWRFLDKTPRYYLIIPELYRVFPKAHYIILLRNPLAVLCSILRVWTKPDWLSLYRFRQDLVQAPQLLLEGIELLRDRGTIVHYEQLVQDPEAEVRRMCGTLGVDFVPAITEYGHHGLPRWRFGDQQAIYQHTRPVSESADKWVQALDDAQVWRLANDYLRLLGQSKVDQMGYPYGGLCRLLEAERPQRIRVLLTFSLPRLLEKSADERSRWIRGLVRFMCSLQRRGVARTAIAGGRRLVHALSHPR